MEGRCFKKRVRIVKQEQLLAFNSTPFCSRVRVAQSLFVFLCRQLFVCVLFLLTIVLSVLLFSVASYYPFCIFKPFQANVSFTYRIMIMYGILSSPMVILPEIDGSVDIDSFVDIDVSATT